MGFEPTTSALGRLHSTAELRPQVGLSDGDGLSTTASVGNGPQTVALIGIGGSPLSPLGEVGFPSKSIQQWFL
jgi:hypothetical protein